ncbi:efflux RND transporter periplasmic adaptor subunit [Pseudomonas chlororaphis]|uniref:efflux RND transporter periplasmic adaptor subunit n=1 Tax=Pseudomonas chlororaphis TaxID=587753 RepID=UPI001E2CCB01|nr:efflux RND transporter periplasmic adaptor subunit [Pseudomonas chlororaphis]MCB2254987.1 efflux RND transporter periplasmic adaptor subunit [Pseudomonas chlororaphis]
MTLLKTVMACGFVGSLGLVLVGCREEARQEEPLRPVRTVIAKAASLGEEVAQTGEVQAEVMTDLGFRIGGRVAARMAEVGMSVAKGQVLATLDPNDVQNEVRSAEAELVSAEATEQLSRSQLNQQRTLFARQFVARARVEEAEANWRAANARLNVAKTRVLTVRDKLSYTELRAPGAAIVSAVAVNAGQVVEAGQVAIKLASTNERVAVFNISERLYTSVPSDAKVEVALISDPSVKVIGSIRDASPTADMATRTYRVRVTLPDAPPTMTLGATVTGRLALGGKPLVLLPAAALTSVDGNPAVYVVQPSTHELLRKPVVVARYTVEQAIIESGLAEGDAVVVAGVSKFRPGQKVAYDAGQVTP